MEWEIPKPAKPWHLLLARLFGKKHTGTDGQTIVTAYEWRGIIYVSKITPSP